MRRAAAILTLALALPGVLASFAGQGAAVSYLDATQDAEGGWGTRAATDWTLLGLAAAGEDPRAWGVDGHLLAHPPEPTSLLAWERATLALACAGWDARDFHGVNYALVVELAFLGTQFGNPSWLHDDFWAILALRAAGTPAQDVRLQLSASYVLDGRHPGGGWSWSRGATPDADDTGAALMALAAAEHPARGPAVADALAWLRAHQNADGGWGIVPGARSNLPSTAWVAMGLLATGEDLEEWRTAGGAGPLDLLAALQQADGGFRYDAAPGASAPMLTGTALPPLLGASYVCRP